MIFEGKEFGLQHGTADTLLVLIAVDRQGDVDVGMAKCLGHDLGIDAVVEPGLCRAVPKRVEIIAPLNT